MTTLIVLYLIFGAGMIWGYTKSKKNPLKPIPKLVSMVSAIAIVMVAILSPLLMPDLIGWLSRTSIDKQGFKSWSRFSCTSKGCRQSVGHSQL